MEEEYRLRSFHANEAEVNMVSLPWRIVERDALFRQVFEGYTELTVVDLYANVGGDTLAFMAAALRAKRTTSILAVQHSAPEDDDAKQTRFQKLDQNVDQFYPRVDKYVSLGCFNQDVKFFMEHTLAKQDMRTADLLYMDPPWNLPEGYSLANDHGTAANPSAPTLALVRKLEKEVFGPLFRIKYPPPRVVCIKAPTPFDQFRVVLFKSSPYLRAYTLLGTLPIRNSKGSVCMYFHILITSDEDVPPPSNTQGGALDPTATAFVPGQ